MSELTTNVFTAVFILMFLGIAAMNIWMIVEFKKISFTPQTRNSKTHKIFEALLILIIAGSSLVALLGFILFTLRNSRVWALTGPFTNYKVPLIAIIVSLLLFSFIQLILSLMWPRLVVQNPNDKNYMDISTVLVLYGYLSLPTVIIILFIWYWYSNIEERKTCKELRKYEKKIEELEKMEKNMKIQKDLEEKILKKNEELEQIRNRKRQSEDLTNKSLNFIAGRNLSEQKSRQSTFFSRNPEEYSQYNY